MAFLPLLSRRRRQSEEGGVPGAPLPSPRRSVPPAAALRRERRTLLRLREESIRDLGGLLLEMYRRDVFREELLRDHCDELVALEGRLHEIDALLAGEHPGF